MARYIKTISTAEEASDIKIAICDANIRRMQER